MIGRLNAFGRTQRSSCRRRTQSMNHLLRTHEQSRGSARGQHQVGHHSTGRWAVLSCALLADKMRTRARVKSVEEAHAHEAQSCSSAALAANHRRRELDVVPQRLHTAANRSRGQSSELWERATGPLIGPAKPQLKRLTCRGSSAPDEASIARSSEPSKVEVGICA